MKRLRVVGILLFLISCIMNAAGFAQTLSSPYKMGSLLIFPLIDTTGDRDTMVTISNEFYENVEVMCWYRTASGARQGSVFSLGPWEGASFSARGGDGDVGLQLGAGEKGELKCWAVSPGGDHQISWNYLHGNAQILDPTGAWGYSSWNFAANLPRRQPVGEPGEMLLTGAAGHYDAMPRTLSFALPGTLTEARVSLLAGKEDFRQDYEDVVTKANFTYSRGRTSGHHCIRNWGQVSIAKVQMGNFKVKGIASRVCDTQFKLEPGTTENTPLLGVVEARQNGFVYGIMPVGIGFDGTGYILWDKGGEPPE